MSAAHSSTPASSAARRIQCPGSALAELQFPDQGDGSAAAEGEAAHWCAAQALRGHPVALHALLPNGVRATEEMLESADLWFDTIRLALEPHGLLPHQCEIEQTIPIPSVHPGHFGTPDSHVLIDRPGKPFLLFVWDFKFGHRPVEVFENPQLIDYISGATTGVHDLYPGADIVATVVQPRSFSRDGPVRTWRTTLADLRAHFNVSAMAAEEALGPLPRYRTGPECRDCRARHACAALQREGFAAMDEATRVPPLEMSAADASLELLLADRALERLTARRSGLAQHVEHKLKRGEAVPGWSLVRGQSRETWSKPTEQVLCVGTMMGLSLAKPPEPITPTQARQRGLPDSVVSALASRPPAGMVLVGDDGSIARRIFAAPEVA